MRLCKLTKFGSEEVVYLNPAIVHSVAPRKKGLEGADINFGDGESLTVSQEPKEAVKLLDKALAG